jgi:hypothetical protein
VSAWQGTQASKQCGLQPGQHRSACSRSAVFSGGLTLTAPPPIHRVRRAGRHPRADGGTPQQRLTNLRPLSATRGAEAASGALAPAAERAVLHRLARHSRPRRWRRRCQAAVGAVAPAVLLVKLAIATRASPAPPASVHYKDMQRHGSGMSCSAIAPSSPLASPAHGRAVSMRFSSQQSTRRR